jgi:hypothetical protein
MYLSQWRPTPALALGAYTMRRCEITDILRAGIDVSSVAKIAGASIMMINSHYAKFVQADVRAKLASITAL